MKVLVLVAAILCVLQVTEVECKTKTTDGKCCSFPFTYKGVTYNYCTKIDHDKLWCSLDTSYKGRWGNCVECKTKTTDGKCCSFPFTYKGVTYNSCTKIDHRKLWCSLDTSYKGRWGNCVECKTKTTDGKCCSLPFTYNGVTYNSCTKIDHDKLWCSLDTCYKGRWGNCEVECKTKTTDGKCCSFPFTYKGVTYNSCTNIDHNMLWCSLDTCYKGRWGNCEVECKTKTTDGKCCSFPFTYKGVTYNSCTKIDHNKLWCSLDTSYKGRWGNCVECKTKTTNGKCCSFPFTYKGVTYNSCTKIDHNKLWCSLDTSYKGRWGNCVLRPK
ncbi:epididymal sperm-binding protein 1-like isoform X3 [Acropora muricata]|uniref:epididymal sperm-binding protein 1-like isoform X3 n=1 Tax=Acropora muricata TaxID=159855 RepID=UPI0034E5DCDB